VRGELGKRLGKRCHIFPPYMKIKELKARPPRLCARAAA
jgi:hypothetical protein